MVEVERDGGTIIVAAEYICSWQKPLTYAQGSRTLHAATDAETRESTGLK